jgi:hypothetical protein
VVESSNSSDSEALFVDADEQLPELPEEQLQGSESYVAWRLGMLVDVNNANYSSDSELTVLASSEIDAMEDLISGSGGGDGDDDDDDDEVVGKSHDSGNSEVYMTRSGRVYNPF